MMLRCGNPLLFLLFAGTIFFYLIPQTQAQQYDWDYMNCHNHGWYRGHNYTGDDICVCDPPWGGVDCSFCFNDTSCGKKEKCMQHLHINKDNYYNCWPQNPAMLYGINGTIAAEFHFPDCVNGNGSISVFNKRTGAPMVFNCTFSGCTKDEGDEISCQDIKCHCTEWCSSFTAILIDRMTGLTTFNCDSSTSLCHVRNPPLMDVMLVCSASTCEEKSACLPPPEPHPMPLFEKVVIIIGSIFGGIGLFVASTFVIVLFMRRRNAVRRALWYSLDHSNAPVILSFKHISCYVRTSLRGASKQILFGVSGIARPGQITAIMGPSGGGKTTLIDILAGRKSIGKVIGDVLVNGEIKRRNFKRISGYVLQDDIMMGTLTVREQVTNAAMLRLPSLMPYEEKIQRVDRVLEDLGISHIANSFIGTDMTRGISGGERKRVSIATELVTNPNILFLDEPTSGLDAYNASSLMQTLKRLALDHNTTIVMSIHQPRSDIFYQFDNLIVLSQGRNVFSGSPVDAAPYFAQLGHVCPQNFNPADFIIDTITMHPNIGADDDFIASGSQGKGNNLDIMPNEREKSIQGGSDDGDIEEDEEFPKLFSDKRSRKHENRRYASSFWTQFYILCRRTIINIIRDPYLLRAQYILTVALSILIGFIFKDLSYDLYGVQGRAGSLFFLVCLLSFSTMSSLDTFFHERTLFVREKAQGAYRTSAYFFAKTICDIIPMRVIPPIVLGSVTFWMETHPQLDPEWIHSLWCILVLVLISVVACSMCFAISCSFPSIGVSNLVAIILLLFFMLFGGLFANKTTIPEYIIWFKWLSFMNYGYEVLMVNELQGTTILFNPPNVPPVYVTGEEFLQQFDMDPNRWQMDIEVLCGMAVGYLIIAYLFLRFYIKERR